MKQVDEQTAPVYHHARAVHESMTPKEKDSSKNVSDTDKKESNDKLDQPVNRSQVPRTALVSFIT